MKSFLDFATNINVGESLNFALFLQDKGPWLAEMANWQVNAARNMYLSKVL